MIELYTWTTPNGQKVSIMLEEVGLPYRIHPIDITKDEQFAPEFLKIAPNNKIPAVVDTDNGFYFMESGAILMYLADKTGRLWPQEFPVKWRVVEWLMWQMGGPGPFLGQVHHFVKFNPGKSPYAEERYAQEAKRLWRVLDRRLADGGTAHGEIADSEAKADIWEDFAGFEATAMKLMDASASAANAAAQGAGAFTAAFNDMTKVCKDCHQTYREKLKE